MTANSGTSFAAVKKLLTCAPARTPRTLMNASTPTSTVRMSARGSGSVACGQNSPRYFTNKLALAAGAATCPRQSIHAI